MDLLSELKQRGLFYQSTRPDEIEEILKTPQKLYIGFDPTAESLHIGNLLGIIVAYHFIKYGHRVVFLAGGATGLIGDPSFKNKERPLLSKEQVEAGAHKISKQIADIYEINKNINSVEFVNNADWFNGISYIGFLRDVGKYFTINSMIKKDFIASRLTDDNSISYTEFSYSLIQGYDFYHLYKNHNVTLQIGGSDQWGNMLSGVELIHKKLGENVDIITYPLAIDKKTGKKFGKSEGNAIWINPDMLSIFDLYQFFVRIDDENAEDLYRKYSVDDINNIEANIQKGNVQKLLAYDTVKFLHGKDVADVISDISYMLYSESPLDLLNKYDVETIKKYTHFPTVNPGINIVDALIKSGLAESKSEAKKLISQKAVKVNGDLINNFDYNIDSSNGGAVLIQKGKRERVIAFID